MSDHEWSSESLREWERNPKGKAFWEAISERFKDGMSEMRKHVRDGNLLKAMYDCSQVDAAEEILQLIDVLIEEKNQETQDKETKI